MAKPPELWRFALLLAALWLTAGTARAANCLPANITFFSVSPVNMGSYSPYAPAPLTRSLTVSIGTNANCTNLFFAFSAASGNFAPTATSLVYTLPGAPLAPGSEDKVNVNNTTVTRTFSVNMAAGQLAGAGSHTNAAAPIIGRLYLKNGGTLFPVAGRALPVNITVTVPPACQLPSPSVSSVDFAAALSSGVANAAIVRNIVFNGASCLAPTRIRISGAALQPPAPLPPRPGFSNQINWQAQATFGLASVALTTTGATPTTATSVTRNAGGTGATSGNITIGINLVGGTRPLAGNYGGTLTILIDPAL